MGKFGGFVALLCLLVSAVQAQQVVLINGHHMIALRDFSQYFGAYVGYDNQRNAISISLGGRVVEVIPYSTTAWIDGNPVVMRNPVVIVDDVTYLPFRFMVHAFNLPTTWHGNQDVVVTNPHTTSVIQLGLDLLFGQRPHSNRRDYDPHEYQNIPPPPAHPGPPERPGGNPRGNNPPQGGHPRGNAPQGGTPHGNTPRGAGQPQGGGARGTEQGHGGNAGGHGASGGNEHGGH